MRKHLYIGLMYSSTLIGAAGVNQNDVVLTLIGLAVWMGSWSLVRRAA